MTDTAALRALLSAIESLALFHGRYGAPAGLGTADAVMAGLRLRGIVLHSADCPGPLDVETLAGVTPSTEAGKTLTAKALEALCENAENERARLVEAVGSIPDPRHEGLLADDLIPRAAVLAAIARLEVVGEHAGLVSDWPRLDWKEELHA